VWVKGLRALCYGEDGESENFILIRFENSGSYRREKTSKLKQDRYTGVKSTEFSNRIGIYHGKDGDRELYVMVKK